MYRGRIQTVSPADHSLVVGPYDHADIQALTHEQVRILHGPLCCAIKSPSEVHAPGTVLDPPHSCWSSSDSVGAMCSPSAISVLAYVA